MMPDIESGDNRANSAARKFHDSRDMCRRIDRDLRPVFRLAGHGTFRKGRLHRGGYTPDWPRHCDERCEIIGANIKHGATARLREEARGGMATFPAVIRHERWRSNTRPELPV